MRKKGTFWRIKIVYYGFIVIVLFVIAFLFRWQILEYDRYRTLANQRVKDVQLSAIRGTILAADGAPLALSEPTYDVFVYLPEVNDAEELGRQTRSEFITKVANELDLKKEYLEESLSSGLIYIVVKRKISIEQKAKLDKLKTNKDEERKLVGLHFEHSERRVYPDGRLACHVTGFVGKNRFGEDVGRNGIEGYWDGDLGWKEGMLVSETDSFGNQILTGDYVPVYAKEGRTIKLTIQRGLQEIVEKKIKKGVKQWDAVSGSIVVMDPRTGAVLAMANYPNYDPNDYGEIEDYSVFKNKSVADPYEFGSVGKVYTAAAAIDLGVSSPDDLILASHEGCVNVLDDKEICTSSKEPSGALTLTDVLAYSDNIGAFYTAERVGAKNMHDYLKEFGIGEKTYVGLGEESTSYLKPYQKWNRADVAAYSFGQGYSATPLQIASALSAIPNEGKRMQPYIVSKVYDEDKTIEIKPRVASTPLDKESAQIVNEMMAEVFSRNGSKWQYRELFNYKLAGKSGTASVLDDSGLKYATDKVNVTFVGWDASDNPKFIMIAKLEKPEGAPYSVESVQPLWMETFLEIKDFVGVVPIVG